MDILTKKARSLRMSRVRSARNRSTEWKVRSLLMRERVRGWRMNVQSVAGAPDFVFPALKLAVFVDGCFWHGCPEHYSAPKSNAIFWRRKLGQNRRRDAAVRDQLLAEGWVVLQFWEHEVEEDPVLCATEIESTLDKLNADFSGSRVRWIRRGSAERHSRSE